MTDTQNAVCDIIAREARIARDRITPESTLRALEIDSLDAIQIIFTVEKDFDIDLMDSAPAFDTGSVASLVASVEAAIAQRQANAIHA